MQIAPDTEQCTGFKNKVQEILDRVDVGNGREYFKYTTIIISKLKDGFSLEELVGPAVIASFGECDPDGGSCAHACM
jgi:hypothetical protein